MWFSITAFTFLPDFIPPAIIRGGLFFFLLACLLPDQAWSQPRPVMRPARRDYVAGRFVLIPADASPEAYRLPGQIGQIADHEIIVPPRSIFGLQTQAADPERLKAWVKSVDYADADGVIVSLEALVGPDQTIAPERLELLRWIHTQFPGLPIYGFITNRVSGDQAVSPGIETFINTAVEQVSSGVLADLLIADDGLPETLRAKVLKEIAARRLEPRIRFCSAGNDAAALLTVRHLNRRFGITPRVQPLLFTPEQPEKLRPAISAKIQAAGGTTVDGSDNRPDILLFIHKNESPGGFTAFIETLARVIAAGQRVALADISTERAGRERLMKAISSRKLLDQLYAYAASDDSADGLAVALAQASARLIAAKFLRDDPERLRRTERAQIELLLTHFLKASAYDQVVRLPLDTFVREQLKADPEKLGAMTERAEEFARSELRRLAGEVFSEQFRHNVHAILLSDGSHAEYRVRAIQRFRLTFPLGRTSEPEIRPQVYLFLERMIEAEGARAVWGWREPRNLDDRLRNRYEATNWSAFEAGAGVVEMSLTVTGSSANETAEDYAIRSTLKKQTRHLEITASSARGAFYALSKLELLGIDGGLTQDFQLTESPVFKERGVIENFAGSSWSHRDRLDVLRLLGRARMNRYYYAPQSDPLTREQWRESYTGNDLIRFRELLKAAPENFVELVYTIRPGLTMNSASEEDFAALTQKFEALATLGVRHFALCFADPAEARQKPEDRTRLQLLAAAHAHLTGRAGEYLRRTMPNSTFTVIVSTDPEPQESDYLKELRGAIPPEIPLLIPDHFPTNAAEPWRLNLGAKPGLSASNPAANMNAATSLIAQPMPQAHASLLPLVTTAEYAWNPRAYNPEAALTRALRLLYDTRSRAGMRVWSNTFRDDSRDNIFTPLFGSLPDEVNLPPLEKRLNELGEALENLGTTRERGLLRGELQPFMTRLEKALARLKNDPAYERLPDGSYRKRRV